MEVEARTTVSLIEVIRQPVEQPVDIPVRAWGGTGGRLQGFLPGQYSSSSVEHIADTPVPHHGIFGGFHGFHPGQSTAASSEQLVDIPVPHGGLHLQDPGLASLPHDAAGEAFQGVFSTFPHAEKSAKIGPHSGSELVPESSPSTRAAHSDQFWEARGCYCPLDAGTCSARTQKFSGMAQDDGHGERHWVRLLLRGSVACVVLRVRSLSGPPSTPRPWQPWETGTGPRHASAYVRI